MNKKEKISILINVIVIPLILQISYIYIFINKNIKVEFMAFIIPVAIGFSLGLFIINKKYILGKTFMIMWLLGYYISFYKLSYLQYESKITTQIYIFLISFIPYIVEILFVKFLNKSNIKWVQESFNIKQNLILGALFLIHLILFAYESKVAGIPLLLGNRIQSIGFIHVAQEIFLRVCFYVSAYKMVVKKKYIHGLIVMYGGLYSILVMSRSLTIHFILYIVILGFIYKVYSKKKIGIILCFMLVFFAAMGNTRNGKEFNISEYASMKTDSILISWIYTYIGPNYDNLSLQIEEGQSSNTLSNTLAPILTITGLDKKVSWYNRSYIYIGKLNIGTLYRDYVCDLGKYKSLIPFILTFILIYFLYYSKRNSIVKSIINIVILSEIGICFFTNHFTSSVFWISIIILYFLDMKIIRSSELEV